MAGPHQPRLSDTLTPKKRMPLISIILPHTAIVTRALSLVNRSMSPGFSVWEGTAAVKVNHTVKVEN